MEARKEKENKTMLDQFETKIKKESKNAILFAVSNAKLSEGFSLLY